MNAKHCLAGEAAIRVRKTGSEDPMRFEVAVRDQGGETHHEVTMSYTEFARLGGGAATPEQCIRSTFLFLLDREPKESILRRFDISVIGRYFQEFDREFPRYRSTA